MFGLLETSLIDYPGKICSTIFFPGCNFLCPFCHNPELVKNTAQCQADLETIRAHLEKRRHVLDGVCLTGGEPLLKPKELAILLPRIKEYGLLAKLDTNGYQPRALNTVIKQLDFIAMDIKSSPDKYHLAAGLPAVNLKNLEQSINMIKNSGLDYEFRTTVVPGLYDQEDALKIGQWLKGSKKYVLQQYSTRQAMLDPSCQAIKPYPPSRLKEFQNLLRPYFGTVELRGI
ncbi:MAG: anaerobic ribonucleoside-triphosphate reductase activating protein [Candidatus Margulisiibacteriota bacterium]|jgi:pyruvate formate lyase activating enzyme